MLAALLPAAAPAPRAAAQEAQQARFKPSFLLPVDLAWTAELESGPRHPPAYDRAHVYVGLRNDTLVAVDLLDGAPVWTIGQGIDHPPAAGGGVVVTARGSGLGGWRASDGGALWSADLGSAVAAPPLWSNGWLVAATEAGEIVALRGFDGRELWRSALDGVATVRPAIAGGRLFAPLADGRVAVLALATGATLWERALPGRPQGILPLDALFVGSTDNHLYRLELDDGRIDWFWRTGGDVVGTPVADLEHVYFNARDNVLRALDRRNGARRWRRPLTGRPLHGPLRVGPLIVVAGVSPTVELFDAETGLPRGQYVAPGELAGLPLVIPDARPPTPNLVLITGAGRLVGLTAAAGPPQLPPDVLPPEPLLPRPAAVTLAAFADWFLVHDPAAPAAAAPAPPGAVPFPPAAVASPPGVAVPSPPGVAVPSPPGAAPSPPGVASPPGGSDPSPPGGSDPSPPGGSDPSPPGGVASPPGGVASPPGDDDPSPPPPPFPASTR